MQQGVKPAGSSLVQRAFLCEVELISLDPTEMAQRCREQAENCDDPRTAEFLRELASDYEALAQQNLKDAGDDLAGGDFLKP